MLPTMATIVIFLEKNGGPVSQVIGNGGNKLPIWRQHADDAVSETLLPAMENSGAAQLSTSSVE
jgi:hypothetical protein